MDELHFLRIIKILLSSPVLSPSSSCSSGSHSASATRSTSLSCGAGVYVSEQEQQELKSIHELLRCEAFLSFLDSSSNTTSYTVDGSTGSSIKDLPLEVSWSLWNSSYDRTHLVKGLQKTKYLNFVNKTFDFATYGQFLDAWNQTLVSGLAVSTSISIFREGIAPVWEAPENRNGGKFAFACGTGQEEALQLFFVLTSAIIASKIGSPGDVCGIVISFRDWGGTITVWNSDSQDNEQLKRIESSLSLFSSHHILYQPHRVSMQINKYHIKSKYKRPQQNYCPTKHNNRQQQPSQQPQQSFTSYPHQPPQHIAYTPQPVHQQPAQKLYPQRQRPQQPQQASRRDFKHPASPQRHPHATPPIEVPRRAMTMQPPGFSTSPPRVAAPVLVSPPSSPPSEPAGEEAGHLGLPSFMHDMHSLNEYLLETLPLKQVEEDATAAPPIAPISEVEDEKDVAETNDEPNATAPPEEQISAPQDTIQEDEEPGELTTKPDDELLQTAEPSAAATVDASTEEDAPMEDTVESVADPSTCQQQPSPTKRTHKRHRKKKGASHALMSKRDDTLLWGIIPTNIPPLLLPVALADNNRHNNRKVAGAGAGVALLERLRFIVLNVSLLALLFFSIFCAILM